ncbi:hypothetical protein [Streptomyces plumbiresistens]|uniref:hypothetical protein n=1 Tax=Streptomyces plumbiresistens TaxID=511811 RepID=UPI0031E9F613
MTQERNSGTASHDPLLKLQIRDPAFIDAGVERGGDPLNDCVLVLADCLGQAVQRREAGRREVVKPVRQWGGVASTEH